MSRADSDKQPSLRRILLKAYCEPMSDLENFPVARQPTSTEIEYIKDVYRMGNYAGSFGAFFFFPVLSLFSFAIFFYSDHWFVFLLHYR